jgi:hypothetical protein
MVHNISRRASAGKREAVVCIHLPFYLYKDTSCCKHPHEAVLVPATASALTFVTTNVVEHLKTHGAIAHQPPFCLPGLASSPSQSEARAGRRRDHRKPELPRSGGSVEAEVSYFSSTTRVLIGLVHLTWNEISIAVSMGSWAPWTNFWAAAASRLRVGPSARSPVGCRRAFPAELTSSSRA